MRLTTKQVELVHEVIKKATGTIWLQTGAHPDGSSKYVLIKESEQVVYGGKGAAEALSYLSGVAAGYGVDVLNPPGVAEVLDYLFQSRRFNGTFGENGRDRGRALQAKAASAVPRFTGEGTEGGCEWTAGCGRFGVTLLTHPERGSVPACQDCMLREPS